MKIGTSYFANRAVEHVREDMRGLKSDGFTHVLHTMSEDDIIWQTESMREIVKASHEEGLKVYIGPWAVGNAFGGEALSRFVSYNLTEWQVASDHKKYPMACLNSRIFRDYMHKWIDIAYDIGADTVFLDEPHWLAYYFFVDMDEKTWGCRCDKCEKLYKDIYGTKMPEERTAEVDEFKRRYLNDFIFEMADYSKQKGMEVAVCMLPILECEADRKQWEDIISHPSIDVFATDPYWETGGALDYHFHWELEEFISFFSKEAKELCDKYNKEAQVWIQSFGIKGDCQKIERAFNAAHSAGIKNIFTWSYKAGLNMSSLRSKEPQKAWDYFVNAARKASKEVNEIEDKK